MTKLCGHCATDCKEQAKICPSCHAVFSLETRYFDSGDKFLDWAIAFVILTPGVMIVCYGSDDTDWQKNYYLYRLLKQHWFIGGIAISAIISYVYTYIRYLITPSYTIWVTYRKEIESERPNKRNKRKITKTD